MKESTILGAIGFYGAMFAFGYFGKEYVSAVLSVWVVVSVYCWLRWKKDEEFLEKLPPLFQGIVVFALSTLFVSCICLAIGILILFIPVFVH